VSALRARKRQPDEVADGIALAHDRDQLTTLPSRARLGREIATESTNVTAQK